MVVVVLLRGDHTRRGPDSNLDSNRRRSADRSADRTAAAAPTAPAPAVRLQE